MPFARFIARELAHPSGLLGRWILTRLWNKRNSALNDFVFERLALRPEDRVLEVGFGGGYLIDRMLEVTCEGFVAGVDASPTMVAFCRKRFSELPSERLDLGCAPAEALPHPAASFSKACSVNSIFYWQDPSKALAEIGRVLRPSGRLALCLTCKESLARKGFAEHGLRLFGQDEVQGLLVAAGFEAVQVLRASDRHRQFLCFLASKPACPAAS